jgi:hypothetical protein
MSKNESLSNNQFQIFEIASDIYQNEKFFENYVKNQEYQGYLIEKNVFDELKNEIEYEKLRNLLSSNKTFKEIEKAIKERKEKIKEIIPKKYNTSSELEKELNENKSFNIIKIDYMSKISEPNKLKGKEIKFIFDTDNIIIILNEKDKLYFCNNNGLIEKTFLKQNNEILVYNPNNKIMFKEDLEILINNKCRKLKIIQINIKYMRYVMQFIKMKNFLKIAKKMRNIKVI